MAGVGLFSLRFISTPLVCARSVVEPGRNQILIHTPVCNERPAQARRLNVAGVGLLSLRSSGLRSFQSLRLDPIGSNPLPPNG